MNSLYAFGAVALSILILDAMWLTSRFSYHSALLKSVQGGVFMAPRLLPAALVYVLIPVAIMYFVLSRPKDLKAAAIDGAVLGVAMYGLYDLTNYATLKGWTLEMAVTDTLWGAFVSGVGAAVGAFVLGAK